MVSMSRSAGTLRRRLAPSDRSVAHRMGSAAFLAPLTWTEPRSGPAERMRMASIPPVCLNSGSPPSCACRSSTGTEDAAARRARTRCRCGGSPRPSVVTTQIGGRDPRTSAPSVSSCESPSAASTRGKSPLLLGLHVVREEQAERLGPRLERRLLNAGRQDAPQLRAQHEVWRLDLRHVRRDGTWAHLRYRVFPEDAPHGRVEDGPPPRPRAR